MTWRLLALWMLAAAIISLAWSYAKSQPIPAPCLELAQRHGKAIPETPKQAKRAEAEVRFRAFFGDKLAKECRAAIDAEKRK